MDLRTSVHLVEEAGIYRLVSSSPTTYYVDSVDRPVRLYRATADRPSERDEFDDMWVTVVAALSGPLLVDGGRVLPPQEVDARDTAEWVVRVGSRVLFELEGVNQCGQVEEFTRTPRVTEAIERLDAVPSWDQLPLTSKQRWERYGVCTAWI